MPYMPFLNRTRRFNPWGSTLNFGQPQQPPIGGGYQLPVQPPPMTDQPSGPMTPRPPYQSPPIIPPFPGPGAPIPRTPPYQGPPIVPPYNPPAPPGIPQGWELDAGRLGGYRPWDQKWQDLNGLKGNMDPTQGQAFYRPIDWQTYGH